MCIKYYESVSVDLLIQHANACTVLCCHVASPAVLYFSMLPHKWHYFRGRGGGYWTQNLCFDFLYNFCQKTFSF